MRFIWLMWVTNFKLKENDLNYNCHWCFQILSKTCCKKWKSSLEVRFSRNGNLFSATVVTVFGWVASIFTVWFVHRHLERSWRKDVILTNASEIEEIGAEHTKDLH